MAPTSSPPRAASGVAGGAFCRGAAHLQALAAPTALDDRKTDACFIVRDASRQALAYVYFEEEPGRRSAANLLTRDEARRIAANIAKPPELRRGPPPIKRGVTRLEPYNSRQSAQCRLRPQVRKYRRNALSIRPALPRSSTLKSGAIWLVHI
jgi:hypothetical protein